MATGMHLNKIHIPLLTCALLSGGCSCLIAESGKDLAALTTKEQVHQALGTPKLTGVTEGQPFEEFESRQKIADPMRAATDGMSVAMTYGFGELITFPQELYLLCSRTLFGQNIRVTYAPDGSLTGVFLDDERIDSFANRMKRSPQSEPTVIQAEHQNRSPAGGGSNAP